MKIELLHVSHIVTMLTTIQASHSTSHDIAATSQWESGECQTHLNQQLSANGHIQRVVHYYIHFIFLTTDN